MKRRGALIIATTGAVAAALGIAANGWRTERAATASSATADLFAAAFADADGTVQPLAQWRGRPLIVNFWATWCAPCVEEMPELQKIRDEYRPQGVEVIGLGIDSAQKITAFRDKLGLTLPLLVAGAGGSDLYRTLGNTGGVLPFTVLIDADGRIRERRVGQVSSAQLRQWLGRLLPAGPARSL